MKQLEFFDTRDVSKEMDNMKKDWEKTRRSLYAKNSELQKRILELEHEHNVMKMHLCKGKIVI